MKQTLLICGDSFAANWQVKYPNVIGWPNMMASNYEITNLAQAGCSQYKVLKQIQSVNLEKFDKIIISHSSPYRLFSPKHPIHYADKLHKDSDLIYSDVKEHAVTNKELLPLVEYFEKYYDLNYAEDIYTLLCKEIVELTKHLNILHLVHRCNHQIVKFDNQIDCSPVFKNYHGLANHYSDEGNKIIYDQIIGKL